jgi:hypothetical protein
MRIRVSGMPDETFWEWMFHVPLIVFRLRAERFGDAAAAVRCAIANASRK